MNANQRFSLIDDRYIVDRLDLSGEHIECYWMEGDPKDDMYLRERVLRSRLTKIYFAFPGHAPHFAPPKYSKNTIDSLLSL
jgi:hypothetical protein